MILQMMTCFDKKARAFLPPFFTAHVDVGVRVFAQCANDGTHQVCLYAEDFSLWHLGTFNDESGLVERFPQPVHKAEAIQLKGEKHVQSKVA